MKSKIIALVLLASVAGVSHAGDFEKVIGGVLIGAVIGSQIADANRGPVVSAYPYPYPNPYPPQVVYGPPPVVYSVPQVVYQSPPPVYGPAPVYYRGHYDRDYRDNPYRHRWEHRDHDRRDYRW
jgi:hypothetical protein